MRKLMTIPALAATSLALATGAVVADDHEVDDDEVAEEVEAECPDAGDGGGEESPLLDAAQDAAAAADDLEDGEACEGLMQRSESAIEALSAALERLSEEGAGGNGVAAQVLQALIDGESPSGIGAGHGAEMAAAAAERRAERQAERAERAAGKPDHAGAPEGKGKPDHAGRPDGAGRP